MANIINRQQTFATNGTVDAASLHNLIDTALINSAIIKNQDEITTIGTSDLLLIAPSSVDAALAPRKVTVQNLIEDSFTLGTYVNLSLTGSLTYGTATGNRTISTSATITNGTITNLSNTSGTIANLNSTTGTIATLNSTTGIITTLNSTTGTIATLNSTTGTVATLNSTTGTIGNLSTTLAGDFTISQGTGTLGTSGATLGTYGGATSVPVLAIDAKGRVTTASTSAITSNTGFRNRIINGEFGVAQRGTSFVSGANDDDSYNLDRWYVLSDGNDAVDITQETSTVPTNQLTAIALDVETANKKFGIAQIIEQKNCIGLIGGNVTLSFKAKVSSTTKLDNVKAAVVAWSGTADTVTSDIISAWGAEGTDPTLIANATFENTPANLSVTTSYATYTLTANVDTASTKNLIVFIWSDVTDTTAGDFLYITDVQLEVGSTATDFERRPIGTELAMCQRYYSKSYSATVVPGTSSVEGYATNGGLAGGTSNSRSNHRFSVEMRATPTMSYWDYVGNANRESSHVGNNNRTDNIASGSFSLTPSSSGFGFNDAGGAGNAGAGAWWSLVHWVASIEL
jgi:hypothetical protein